MDIGLLQMKILWLLKGREMHGYEIVRELSKQRKVSHPNIYVALRKLVNSGLVAVRNDGRRKVYHITAAGARALNESMNEFVKMYEEFFRASICSRCSLWKG